jgi:sortase B
MKGGRILRTGLFVLLLGVFCVSAYQLYQYWREGQENQKVTDRLFSQAVTVEEQTEDTSSAVPISVDFDQLKKENQDIVAWLYCPDTIINYPVLQAEDNSYYLHRLADGSDNKAGSLFMDCRNQEDCSDWDTVIYGHHMKDKSMFGTLVNYREQEYYDQHPVLYLFTPEKEYEIDLVAGFVTEADSEVYTLPQSQEELDDLLTQAKEVSTFLSDVEVLPEERIVTLSTCSYEYEDARFVVLGVLRELAS